MFAKSDLKNSKATKPPFAALAALGLSDGGNE